MHFTYKLRLNQVIEKIFISERVQKIAFVASKFSCLSDINNIDNELFTTSYLMFLDIIYANVQGNILMRLQFPTRKIIQSKPKIMLCSAQFELNPN